jgi:hypothetical protein
VPEILKCLVVESKAAFILEREEENIGSRATLPTG